MSAPWLTSFPSPPRMASQEDEMRARIAGASLPGVAMWDAAEAEGWNPITNPTAFVERRAVPRLCQCGAKHAGGVA